MKRTTFIILLSIISISYIFAQTEDDALRLSKRFYGATARSAAMGGAFAALGGDFSTLGYNPAGIGVFRTTEFSFTPSFSMDEINTRYLGTKRSETEYSFGLNSIGFVASFNSGKETGWVGTNLGFGYNRHNNFNRSQIIEGANTLSSMADYFLDGPFGANGWHPDDLEPFWERLAYDTYIIDLLFDDSPWEYGTPVPESGSMQQRQREIISTSGHTGEYLFSLGANYSHRFYMGATFGIETVNYTRNSNYTETDELNISNLEMFRFKRNLNTSGTGYTFKAGAILKPIEMIRLGASVHLPTFYNLTDEYHHEMEAWYVQPPNPDNNFVHYTAVPENASGNPIGPRVKDYSMTTPFRAIGGLGIMLPLQLGVISVDYEYVDYTTMKLRETDGGHDFHDQNQVIKDVYRQTGNLKAGAEIKLGTFMLRGGYALYGSPFASGQMNEDAGFETYSGGFGFRNRNFYMDLGYVMTMQDKKYLLYDYEGMQPALGKGTNNRFLVTVGFRF